MTGPAPLHRKNLLLLAAIALAVAGLLVAFQKYVVRPSCIATTVEMRYELVCRTHNAATCLDDWMWDQRTPYKYRILGRTPIWVLYEAGIAAGIDKDHAALYAFTAFLVLFTASTLFVLALLCRNLLQRLYPAMPERTRARLIGLSWALFILSPPILFFVKYPVRGAPNDMLGFTLMMAALLLMSQRRIKAFTVLSVIAVFCRETTLLIPFIFLFFDPLPWRRKLLPALLPVAVLAIFRAAWPGTYPLLDAGIFLNLKVPVETLGFLLLTFGPLWVLAPLGWISLRRMQTAQQDPFVRTLVRSFPWAFLLTMVIDTAFTSLWEIRTSYILMFHFVPLSMLALYQQRARIAAVLKHRYFLFFVLAVLIESVRFWFWMHPLTTDELYDRAILFDNIFYGYWDMPREAWVGILATYLPLTVLCLPLLLFARPGGTAGAAGASEPGAVA